MLIKNNDAVLQLILGLIIAVILIVVIGFLILLGMFFLFGMWTLIGLGMVVLAIILACVKPEIKIWIPVLIIGVILLAVEYIEII